MKDTFVYDFNVNDFVLSGNDVKTATGIDALKIWIEKALRTSKGYKIYTSYGNNIEKLVVGQEIGFGFTESEIKREVTEILSKNDDINNINSINITRDRSKLKIEIDMETTYGDYTEVISFDGR